jgi:integrase
MQRKRRHQQGTLTRINTGEGIWWEIRFVDHTPGNPKRPRFLVGPLASFPTPAAASRAAQPIRDTFNRSGGNPLLTSRRTFGDLIDRYLAEELPPSHSAQRGYKKMIRCHIRPRWGTTPIAGVKAQEVRAWLRELELLDGGVMSSRYRGHLHDMMRRLFRCGMLWEWVAAETNPMSLFSLEGSTKRESEPGILSVEQFQRILAQAPEAHLRVMLIAVMCLGVRVSEMLALKWADFDFNLGIVRIRRAIVEGHVGKVKTIHSKKPLPLDYLLIQAFFEWRAQTPFSDPEDWVFANSTGENPHQASTIQTRVLIPIGKTIGLGFSLGWHTFRHSYKSWMDQAEVPLTVQRDLMRHADIRTTAQIYGQVRLEELRGANSDVVKLAMKDVIFPNTDDGKVN